MVSTSYESFLRSPYRTLKVNSYFPVYDCLLEKYRNRDVTFVEIGVLGGGSLFMWRDFFGPRARIIGVDLNPEAKKWEKFGFEIYVGSQSDQAFWDDFKLRVPVIDVLLDDGGHTYDQQIITVEALAPIISDGGLIVVEDTHTSYMRGFGPKKYSFINYAKNLIDRINMRYFSESSSEKRFWSIEFFESIVVFRFNKIYSEIHTEILKNNGIDDGAVDFRAIENLPTHGIFGIFIEWAAKKKFIKKYIRFNSLRQYVAFKSKKFFKK